MWVKLFCGLVAVVAIILGVAVEWLSVGCHRGIQSPHQFLATKTPYLHPAQLRHHASHDSCTPIQIWMVVRHGTRNPSAKVIRKIINLLPNVRDQIVKAHENGVGTLCPSDLDALKKWSPPPSLTESNEKILVEQGREELRGIGRRFKDRFQNLLGKKYDNSTYKFKFTKTERAAASCKYFVEQVVGEEDAPSVWYPEALAADPILRFYKGCPKWKKTVDKNPEAYNERKKFETSQIFESVRRNVQTRTGSADPVPLEAIEGMYMTCAFETAWTPATSSPWCALFDVDDLEKMQYRQDLEYYWIDGYGFELTYKQACPAVKDMVEHFKSKTESPNEGPSLIAYFTHSGTLLKLISRLGLFNDSTPLLHDNYHLHTTRQWRTNEIDKFATNIAAVLYKCPTDNFKVGLLFQELPVSIPECGDDLCPLDKFLSIYHSVLNDCDIPQMCQL
ncbi:multiple inositol polyphosphate phosphatase 1 [Folsomia candida]|uniref:multiple inositol polyphosphate phosphatase 1 n=1 Tax=Folsomia candida TaxID=158441 RepID=UPI000B8FE62A|nr:multiple inositol polyphosphate phosphatase 1 [Folsomia candida]